MVLDDGDELILEIIGRDSPSLDGLDMPESSASSSNALARRHSDTQDSWDAILNRNNDSASPLDSQSEEGHEDFGSDIPAGESRPSRPPPNVTPKFQVNLDERGTERIRGVKFCEKELVSLKKRKI